MAYYGKATTKSGYKIVCKYESDHRRGSSRNMMELLHVVVEEARGAIDFSDDPIIEVVTCKYDRYPYLWQGTLFMDHNDNPVSGDYIFYTHYLCRQFGLHGSVSGDDTIKESKSPIDILI